MSSNEIALKTADFTLNYVADTFGVAIRFIIDLFHLWCLSLRRAEGWLLHMGASSTHILWLRYRGVEAYVHTHDDMLNLVDPSEYEDPVSQRAMAFCHVAKLAESRPMK